MRSAMACIWSWRRRLQSAWASLSTRFRSPSATPICRGRRWLCTVVAQACDTIRMRLGQDGKPAADVIAAMKDRGMGAREEYAESVPHGVAKDSVQAHYRGAAMPMGGARLPDRIQFAFGAQFVEVRVHSWTREIRVPRMVGAFASGRILNPRTAHSQYMGGMIWGIGSALLRRYRNIRPLQ
jgi:xanthine dehydrogenase YagR molybdenum-binding subunit